MYFHVNVGQIRCTILADGSRVNDPLYATFPSVPEADFMAGLAAAGMENKAVVSFNCLVIRAAHGNRYILVDTGNGISENLDNGKLLDSMKAAGILREDITDVIISHGHGDHFNGVTLPDGRLTFPHARYLMWRSEWERVTDESFIATLDEQRAAGMRTKFGAIRDKLTFIEREGEIVPGVSAIAAPGHTPGQIAISVESDGSRLLYLADVMNLMIQVYQPTWMPRMDMDGVQAVATRRHLLQHAAETNTLTLLYHFPFPGLGYVTSAGETFAWRAFRAST
jgi:glyoxylase-like metal-dependent hydrolase (beta-lactamase superfamily II)